MAMQYDSNQIAAILPHRYPFALVDILDKTADSTLIVQVNIDRFFSAQVAHLDSYACIQECLLPQTGQQRIKMVNGRILEDQRVCLECNLCACLGGITDDLERLTFFSIFKPLVIPVFTVADLDLQPFGKCVYDRSAYPMQAAGYLISASTEFTACMKDGKYNRDRRKPGLRLDADRDTAPVVPHTDDLSRQKLDCDLITVARKCFVDRVVYNLIYQMMKTLFPS